MSGNAQFINTRYFLGGRLFLHVTPKIVLQTEHPPAFCFFCGFAFSRTRSYVLEQLSTVSLSVWWIL